MPQTSKRIHVLLCLSVIFLLESLRVEGAPVLALAKTAQKDRIRNSRSANVLAVEDIVGRVTRETSWKDTPQQAQAGQTDTWQQAQAGQKDTRQQAQAGQKDTWQQAKAGQKEARQQAQAGQKDTRQQAQTGEKDTRQQAQAVQKDTWEQVHTGQKDTLQKAQTRLKDKKNGKKEGRIRSGNIGADINLEGLPPLVSKLSQIYEHFQRFCRWKHGWITTMMIFKQNGIK